MLSFQKHNRFSGIQKFPIPLRRSSSWTVLFLCCQSSLVSSWTTTSHHHHSYHGNRNQLPARVQCNTKRHLSSARSDDSFGQSKKIPPLPRLYNIEAAHLAPQAIVPLTEAQSNYIHVMRLNSAKRWGAYTGHLRIFDERGEWLAKLVNSAENNNRNRKSREPSIVECLELLRSPSQPSNGDNVKTHLYVGRIKKQRRKWILEKATELGVAGIHAVDTEYAAVSDPWEYSKHWLQLVEAAEQCERFTIPELSEEPLSWNDLIQQIAESSIEDALWLVCRERLPSSKSLLQAVQRGAHEAKSIRILVGPEGGWSPSELDVLEALLPQANVEFVSLGPLVLRAETAAISAVATVALSLDYADDCQSPVF